MRGLLAARRFGALVLMAVAVAAMAGCGDEGAGSEDGSGADDGGGGLTEVQYALTASAGPGQAPYSSLPLELGYWKDEGLDVRITPLSGSEPAINGLISSQFDVASSGLSPAIIAINKGAPLKVFYTQVTSSFAYPVVLASSSIQRPADLEGKTIGVQALGSGITATVLGIVKQDGGDPDSIEQLPVGLGAEALNALDAGRVDALALWDEQYAGMEELGAKLRPLTTDYSDSLGFQVGLVANDETVEQRDVAVRVARGIAKAYAFAFANPEEAVRLHFKRYPESKPAGKSDEEAIEAGVTSLNARMENSQKIGQWGGVDDAVVTSYLELLEGAGSIDEIKSLDTYWDGSLLDEINEFDEAAVEKAAKTAGP